VGLDAVDADVETSSEGYARRFAGPVGAFLLAVQERITLELLRPWPGATVLDVGGGHGQLTGALVEAGYRLTVHGSAEACRARVRPWVDAGRAAFSAGPLLALPHRDAGFEVALSYRLLPHVAAWPRLVGELTRVARRAVVVDYPTLRSVNAVSGALFALKKRVEGNTRPFAVFRDRELERTFAACGFRSTARRPEFLLPMALHRGLSLAPASRALEGAAAALGLTPLLGSPVIARFERG
jgi:2-polyprenyl-3-methyl-5-hydroxy-6-metoxy-1,4-benzoquinol methylase